MSNGKTTVALVSPVVIWDCKFLREEPFILYHTQQAAWWERSSVEPFDVLTQKGRLQWPPSHFLTTCSMLTLCRSFTSVLLLYIYQITRNYEVLALETAFVPYVSHRCSLWPSFPIETVAVSRSSALLGKKMIP